MEKKEIEHFAEMNQEKAMQQGNTSLDI